MYLVYVDVQASISNINHGFVTLFRVVSVLRFVNLVRLVAYLCFAFSSGIPSHNVHAELGARPEEGVWRVCFAALFALILCFARASLLRMIIKLIGLVTGCIIHLTQRVSIRNRLQCIGQRKQAIEEDLIGFDAEPLDIIPKPENDIIIVRMCHRWV